VKYALSRLNTLLEKAGYERKPGSYTLYPEWRALIAEWKSKFPFYYVDTDDAIQPQYAIELLHELSKGEAIITTGVGQHQMWAAQFYPIDKPRQFLSSLGLGSMGFGYPAALGAKVAHPDKEVIDIDGDGSFVMNIQELAMARVEGIGAKALVLNNLHLGMVVQWEDRFFNSNRGLTFLGLFADEARQKFDTQTIYPDFMKVCEGFGVPSRRVEHKKDLREAMEWFLAQKTACVLEVMVPYTEHVLPMIPSGATYKDVIYQDQTEVKRKTLQAGAGL
jgi:acetolactate synthase-1/2/3 large subunit